MYGLQEPDEVIMLDVPPEITKLLRSQRGSSKAGEIDILEQDLDVMSKSYEMSLYMAARYNWKIIKCVDAQKHLRTIENINNELYEHCLTIF